MNRGSISFLLTEKECELLERIIYLEPGIDEVLDSAVMEGRKVRLTCDYEGLQECLDALSFEMEQDDGLKKILKDLHEKLENYLKLRVIVSSRNNGRTDSGKAKKKNVYIFDVKMIHYPPKGKKVVRTIAFPGEKSLYQFAGTIIRAFDFFFDHCFAFYGDVNNHPSSEQKEIYELFVDAGEEPTAPHAKGVKKVKVEKVFTAVGKTMLFMFDYGDDWRFSVTLKEIRPATEGEKLPRVLKSVGKAPEQYPPCD